MLCMKLARLALVTLAFQHNLGLNRESIPTVTPADEQVAANADSATATLLPQRFVIAC